LSNVTSLATQGRRQIDIRFHVGWSDADEAISTSLAMATRIPDSHTSNDQLGHYQNMRLIVLLDEAAASTALRRLTADGRSAPGQQ
jgi:hypothetical protein